MRGTSQMDKILIVGKNHKEINASREVKTIGEVLRPASGRIQVHAPDDPEPSDIIAELRAHNPTVLHLISHGTIDEDTGIPYFDVADEAGGVTEISVQDLRDHLRNRSDDETTRRLKCIVLNACHVGRWAHNFRDVADVVIGADHKLPETTAQEFSKLFYSKLASDCSIQQAFGDSVDTLRMEGRTGHERLMLVQAHSGVAAQTFVGRVEPVAEVTDTDGKPKYDAYILFAKEDSGPAYRMANRLEALGATSFVDTVEDQINVNGRNWILEAERAIGQSGCGMVMLSKASMNEVTMREQYSSLLLHCWKNDKRIIPVFLEDADVPEFLRPLVGSDFRDKNTRETYMRELERLKRGILGEPPAKPPLDEDVWP